MRNLLIIIFSLPGLSYGQGWIEYIDRSAAYSINFPSEPTIEEIIFESQQGLIYPAQLYSAQGVRGDAYLVTVVDFSNAQELHSSHPDRTEASGINSWWWDIRASVAHAALNIRERGGEITYDSWSWLEGIEGHQLQITNEDSSRTFVGIYQHFLRLYILEATAPAGSPPPGLFQQSLRFLDEEGVRVRYQNDVNGNKTRIPNLPPDGTSTARVVERSVN
ncbi:MAG: hypothetical protein CMM56_09750 [Rhodospirillaceae bacterium]|nr:hypothetical protein [Rhodospirillaceae bacterium]|tara:strand:+ start:526 stop:1185 length:660 start_codon:yes stop_codon:yes gene_type:complete